MASTYTIQVSTRDIVVAIAFGSIVYRMVRAMGDGGDTRTDRHLDQTHISLVERLYRLRGLLSAETWRRDLI
jgi:hypothetical protein